MPFEIRIPEAGESIQEVRVGAWRKAEGDLVAVDEVVVEIETDKAAMELPAPGSGKLVKILKTEGDEAAIGDVIGLVEEAELRTPSADLDAGPKQEVPAPSPRKRSRDKPAGNMPPARRILVDPDLPAPDVTGSGPGGRVLEEDAVRSVESMEERKALPPKPAPVAEPTSIKTTGREQEPVPMTPLRKAIARNLVAAQQSAALLTTFNEVDMTGVIELRQRYSDCFRERHGVKLGFMSFFVKASVEALRAVPAVNARIEGDQIVYRKYQDIGIAIGGGRGLVVPVLRNAECMSFAEIERAISDFADRARRNKIELSELQGGTFTITNGGVYGSMLSTPIVNPPQSGILGMHAIQDRPMAIRGNVEIRPMMYLALTYDHRIVDGREAVTFLRRIKDLVESPERIWLQV